MIKELEILLEGIKGGRLNILSSKKKELGQNRTKYTIVVSDTAIPENRPKIITKKTKNVRKEKETPKEKVVIYKQENKEKPLPVQPKPPMAEISSIGGY